MFTHPRPERTISAERLGSPEFRERYGVRYNYVAGGMYRGIASEMLVLRMARARLLSFYGTGGLKLGEIESALRRIQGELSGGEPFGFNFLSSARDPRFEEEQASLYLRTGVRCVEASAFTQITPALVRYRVAGLRLRPDSTVEPRNRVLAKVSRLEVAEAFLSPAPGPMLARLVESRSITPEQASLAAHLPMADDLCVEADSGGHTDKGVGAVLLPAMIELRNSLRARHGYTAALNVGLAGGLGTPAAVAAAFVLGADFVLTGSVNQCTVEAGTSDLVKDMLQEMDIHDTTMAPASDLFEVGAKVQVMRKGLLFPGRANRLYDLWQRFGSLDELDERTRADLERNYFRCSLEEAYEEVRRRYAATRPEEFELAERNPKHKMALLFRSYLARTARLALSGAVERRVDFQIHCGPALGAFNRSVRGTRLESWRNRHIDSIAEHLMTGAAAVLAERFGALEQAATEVINGVR